MVDTAFWVPPEKAERLAVIYGPAEGDGLKPVKPLLGEPLTQPTRNPSGCCR